MIKPLPGYVLIEPIEEEQKSAGGVYLPESSKDKPSKGKVVGINQYASVEDEFRHWHTDLHKNQIVIFKKWTNQEVEDQGRKYLLVKFDELLGIVE